MAITALEIRGDVSRRLARRLHAVVTDDAKTCDAERDLRVIDQLRRIPADDRVARGAVLAGGRVRRSFTLGNRTVVTTDAAAQHRRVIEMHGGTKRDRVVAGRTVVGARHMRRRFGRGIELRAADMARAAASRRSFENRIQMAGLAGQIAMHAIEFETGGQMIERNRDRRRCLRGSTMQRRHQDQGHCQAEPS